MITMSSTLLDHLRTTFEDQRFPDDSGDGYHDEWNEVVRGLYANLIGAIREQADTLMITQQAIIRYKDGAITGVQDISYHERSGRECPPDERGTWMSNRTALEVLCQHDVQVRQHLQVIEETPEAIVYRLTLAAPAQENSMEYVNTPPLL